MRTAVVISFAFAAMATPFRANAWNDQGHMTVAYLAYEKLTPAARKRVTELLKANPYASDPNEWPKLLEKAPAGADVDELRFMIAATWPDQIRGNSIYKNTPDGADGGNTPPTDGSATRNTGYDDHALHKYWHYVDTPFSAEVSSLPPIPTPNAETQIETFRQVLSSNATDPLKSYDLTWLLHLVGDVHQPLHCATRVTAAKPRGDDGGNLEKITDCGCKLHAYWDGAIGNSSSFQTVIDKAKTLPKASATAASNLDEALWVEESFKAAKKTAYKNPPIGPDDKGSFPLTAKYSASVGSTSEKRIALAGARLANILNDELK